MCHYTLCLSSPPATSDGKRLRLCICGLASYFLHGEVKKQLQMAAPLARAVKPPWQCKYPHHMTNN